MTTHLLVNGMIRCGQPPGHMAIEGQAWPRDLRVCANVAYTDCPTCKELGREGGLQPGPMMQAAATPQGRPRTS
jgi:hypothetical protein